MDKKSTITRFWLICAVIAVIGCGPFFGGNAEEVSGRPTRVVLDKPISTFVPLREQLQVEVGEPILLESYHISSAQLDQVTLTVNDQLLRSEATGTGPNTFSSELASVELIVGDQPVVASTVSPALPTSAWTLPVRWVGHVPGTYEIRVQVTDLDGQQGDPVIQRIEVQ